MRTAVMIYIFVGMVYAFISLGKTLRKHPHKPWFPRTISDTIMMLSLIVIMSTLYPFIYICDAIQQKTFFPEI